MSKKSLTSMYKTMQEDPFPSRMEISFVEEGKRQTLAYEKVQWEIDGETKGLRYGENPDQPASLYRLVDGGLSFGDVTALEPGQHLASSVELLQSGKHPGKINITDVDSALNILRYLTGEPCAVIVKHNNPSGVALGESLPDAYAKALMADRIAAFGGTVALNREVEVATAELIAESYSEVVVAPEYGPGAVDILSRRKNLRIMRISEMANLQKFAGRRVVELKSLIDGGLVVQWSFVPKTDRSDFEIAACMHDGVELRIRREPSEAEWRDMVFGWLVESGITSNSVIYVKDGVTVGIGTGEQDRVGVAEIARFKAYRNLSDKLCWERHATPWTSVTDPGIRSEIAAEVEGLHGGLQGAVMVSDAFFPFRDGVDVGLAEGVTAVVQPGGSLRDFEVIEACNERDATMVFTGQRSFRH